MSQFVEVAKVIKVDYDHEWQSLKVTVQYMRDGKMLNRWFHTERFSVNVQDKSLSEVRTTLEHKVRQRLLARAKSFNSLIGLVIEPE